MKTISIQAFTFDELSNSAKEKAREWFRESAGLFRDFEESPFSDAIEQGALLGFTFNEKNNVPAILYTGFSSQGDGLCFEGTWKASAVQSAKVAEGWGDSPATEKLKIIAGEMGYLAQLYPNASFTVSHQGRYYHDNCTEFNFDGFPDGAWEDWPENKRAEFEQRTQELKDTSKAFMRWIYRQLETEYNYQNSDDAVDENILANDYLFTADGSRTAVL